MFEFKPIKVGGKTVPEWDLEWDPLDGGLWVYHPELRHLIGLIRVSLRGRIVFIGWSTEMPGGLGKRLADFIRRSPSGRKHAAGKLIYRYRKEVTIEVMVIGIDRHAQRIARQLRGLMIVRHKPAWNQITPKFRRKRKAERLSRSATPPVPLGPASPA